MTTPIFCLPEAMYFAVSTNADQQITTAGELISFVGAYCPLSIAWSTQLTADQTKYWTDTLTANAEDPWDAAKTAEDYAQYTEDSSAMASATGTLSTLIQTERTAVSYENKSLKQVYELPKTLTQLSQLYCMLLRLKQK